MIVRTEKQKATACIALGVLLGFMLCYLAMYLNVTVYKPYIEQFFRPAQYQLLKV